jgi:hypothetical protein
MLLKRFGTVALATLLIVLIGCGKEGSDKRLIDIAVKVKRQERELNRLAKKMEQMDHALNEIQVSLREVAAASGEDEPARGDQTRVADFRETPEYKRMAAALSAIQQRLNLAESDPTQMKEAMADALELADQRKADRQFYKRLSGTFDPQQMTEILDSYVKKYGQDIEDPARWKEFHGDVEQLRRINSDGMVGNQLYEWLVSDLTQRLNTAKDLRFRGWLRRQLADLQSASAEELDGVLERRRYLHNFLQLRDFGERYQIPEHDRARIQNPPWQ